MAARTIKIENNSLALKSLCKPLVDFIIVL